MKNDRTRTHTVLARSIKNVETSGFLITIFLFFLESSLSSRNFILLKKNLDFGPGEWMEIENLPSIRRWGEEGAEGRAAESFFTQTQTFPTHTPANESSGSLGQLAIPHFFAFL